MKIFISQPMGGKTDQEIRDARDEAISIVRQRLESSHELEFLDTYYTDYEGNALQHLGKSIIALGEADAAVFLRGWEGARGCLLENQAAVEYGIPCYYI